jgi:hypothetical protein
MEMMHAYAQETTNIRLLNCIFAFADLLKNKIKLVIMKLSSSLFAAAVVIVPSVNGLSLKLQPILDRACTLVQKSLKLDRNMDCKCTGEYKGWGKGFEGDVTCTLKERTCLISPNQFCAAAGSLRAGISFGGFGGTSLTSDLTGCFDVASGGEDGNSSSENFCLTFKPKGLKLGSGLAKIGTELCNSCDVCTSGTDFKLDCSNIETWNIFGPKSDNCLSLGLV